MSLAITHFAVGATGTLLIVVVLAPATRYRLSLVLLGGGWALVPDAGKLYPHPTVLGLHDSQWADVFWFHYAMDRLDGGDSVVWALVALAILLATSLLLDSLSSGGANSSEVTTGEPAEIGTD